MMRFWGCFLVLATLGWGAGCRTEFDDVPLSTGLIAVTDKFFDVAALSAAKAVVVGYAGKILITTDGGRTWRQQESGTDLALYSVDFANPRAGWISGQDGLILATTDGGETWHEQDSQTPEAIFGVYFIDPSHGWAAADRATYLRTVDGGASWTAGYIEPSLEGVGVDATLAMIDPIFYDVYFVDAHSGWMVGDFGKIFHTTDGGLSWSEQQNSLLGQAGITDALNLPSFFGVSFRNSHDGIVVGLEGKIAKTQDGGEHWEFTAQDISVVDTEPLYAPLLLADGGGWIAGAAGRVLRLRRGDWKRAQLGTPVVAWLRGLDFFEPAHGWLVGGYGTILRTTDGGETWLQSLG